MTWPILVIVFLLGMLCSLGLLVVYDKFESYQQEKERRKAKEKQERYAIRMKKLNALKSAEIPKTISSGIFVDSSGHSVFATFDKAYWEKQFHSGISKITTNSEEEDK